MDAVARWLGWTGLVVAVGGVTLAALVAGRRSSATSRVPVATLTRRAGTLVLAGLATVVLAAVVSSGAPALTGVGGGGGPRAVVAALLGIAVIVVVRRSADGGTVAQWPVCVAIGALLVVWAHGGHAAEGGPWLVGVLLAAAHVGAVGVVAGGLVAVLTATYDDGAARGPLLGALSRPALVALALLAASGLLLTGRHVQSATALLTSPYGRVLLVKVALALVAAALAAAQVRRCSQRPTGARSAAHEWVVLGVVAVGLGVLLTAVPAAVGARYGGVSDDVATVQTASTSDLLVRMSLKPARTGPNVVELEVLSTRRPAPGPVERVDVVIDGPDGQAITRSGVPDIDGRMVLGVVELPSTGTVPATVTVLRSAAPVDEVRFDWTLTAPPPPREHTVLSDAPLGPLCEGLALMVLALGAALALRRGASGAARIERRRPMTIEDDAPSPGARGAGRP